MTNEKIKKVNLNADNLITILKDKNLSIRELGRDTHFKYSAKTIERAIKTRLISQAVIDELAIYLDVSYNFLSGIVDPDLKIYCFMVTFDYSDTKWNRLISTSVISKSEEKAYRKLYDYLLDMGDFNIKFIRALPIIEGTII